MTDDAKPTALEDRAEKGDRLYSPSAARNRAPIIEAFGAHMPSTGVVLEIGSGTGEHGAAAAKAFPGLEWVPSDPDPKARRSIAGWVAAAKLPNFKEPLNLDAADPAWPRAAPRPVDGVVSINMIHIAPFAAAEGLFAGAGEILATAGRLFLYGPFSRGGRHTAPSNADFDASLKSRDPAWGVRDIEHDLAPLAQKHALALREIVEMPANNLVLIYGKAD